mgnify:CR=1 FL=1
MTCHTLTFQALEATDSRGNRRGAPGGTVEPTQQTAGRERQRRVTAPRRPGVLARAWGIVCLALLASFAAAPAPANEAGDGGRYRLQVNGLACPFCAYGIEKKLGGLEGVCSVEVRLDEGSVIVTTRPGATLTEARAREAVEAAGFGLQGFGVLEEPATGTSGSGTGRPG